MLKTAEIKHLPTDIAIFFIPLQSFFRVSLKSRTWMEIKPMHTMASKCASNRQKKTFACFIDKVIVG